MTRWRRWRDEAIVAPLAQVDAEMRSLLASPRGRGIDRKTCVVMLFGTLAIVAIEYGKNLDTWRRVAALLAAAGGPGAWFHDLLDRWSRRPIDRLAWWAATAVVGYVGFPLVALKLVLRERLRDHGLAPGAAFKGWPLYLAMACAMVPVVRIAALDPAFLSRYPFYRVPQGRPIPADFWQWELLYAAQFVALEFFFRGFWVHGLKHRFGTASVLAMTVPYCMIHFGKPLPETLAALVAGVVLGLASLKTRSVWLAPRCTSRWRGPWTSWRCGPPGRCERGFRKTPA